MKKLLLLSLLATAGAVVSSAAQAGTPAEHGIEGYLLRAAHYRADIVGRAWENPSELIAFKAPAPEPAPEPETSAPAPAPVEEFVPPPTPPAVEQASCANDKRFSSNTAQIGWGSVAEYCAAIETAKSYEAQFFGNLPARLVTSHPGDPWEEMRYQQMWFSPVYESTTHIRLVARESVAWLNMENPASSPDPQFWYRPEEFISDIAGLGGCRSAGDITLEEGSSWYANCRLLGVAADILVQASSNSVDIRFHWVVPR